MTLRIDHLTTGRALMDGLPKLPWHHEAIEEPYGDDHPRWGDLYAADGACLFSVETDGFFALPVATAAAICHAVNTWPALAEMVEELERDAALRRVEDAASTAPLRAQTGDNAWTTLLRQRDEARSALAKTMVERDAYRAMIYDLLASAVPRPTEHPAMTKQWNRARELLKHGPITITAAADDAKGRGE